MALALAAPAAASQPVRTYPACNNGAPPDNVCSIGSGYGAQFDGRPFQDFRLCANPEGRQRVCDRFHTRTVGALFVRLWDHPSFDQPGTIVLRWWSEGELLDTDRLRVHSEHD
jgi:hypothetical protein